MSEIDMTTSKDSAELANEAGFTGTFDDFVAWLDRSLVYGGVLVADRLDGRGKPVKELTTITGGYSSDEKLLGRLERNVMMAHSWVSSHRGGKVVYELREPLFSPEVEHTWLSPLTDVFDTVYRVRTVQVFDERGDFVEFAYNEAAELAFSEPNRDICEPAGVLTIRPISVEASISKR